tara:strand:+ start:1934 stop:2107 length:174 start_codon:yes stop_codon:yes gene_type:complete
MVMMDHGQGSSAARAGVFFLAFGFGMTSMFENICVRVPKNIIGSTTDNSRAMPLQEG